MQAVYFGSESITTELSVLPWVLLGVVVFAIIIGWLATLRPEPELGKRWAWKGVD